MRRSKTKDHLRSLVRAGLLVLMALGPAVTSAQSATTDTTATVSAVAVAVAPVQELRVQTPTYQLENNTLRVPGYGANRVPGAPALPVWRTLVELPPTGEPVLTVEAGEPQLLSQQAPLAAAAAPQPAEPKPYGWTEGEDLPTVIPTVDRPDPAIYGADVFYPATLAQAGAIQRQAGRRLLQVSVFPFQYNPVAGVLRYYADIRVTVSVERDASAQTAGLSMTGGGAGERGSGGDASAQTAGLSMTGGGAGERGSGGDASAQSAGLSMTINPAAAPMAGGGSLRIRTGEPGLYRLTWQDLVTAGVPVTTTSAATFAVLYLGDTVDIQVIDRDADDRFEDGDLVIFYAEPYVGRYETGNVYWFTYGDSSLSEAFMRARAVEVKGDEPVVTAITQTLHIENDVEYRSEYARPRDADHWFDSVLYASGAAPVTRTYTLALDDALTGEGRSAVLRTAVHGGLDQDPNPDQSMLVRLNSHDAGLHQWEGSTDITTTATLPAAWLDANPNQVSLVVTTDQLPALTYYWLSPDWVALSYPALADADGDRLAIEGIAAPEAGNAFQVQAAGFTTSTVRVYDVRAPRRPVRLLTTAFDDGAGTLSFWDAALPGAAYALSSEAALLAPLAIEADAASAWRTVGQEADYIAIVHHNAADPVHDLWDAIDPLLARRSSPGGGGYRVAKVDVQDIYDEFNYGLRDPEAIRSFLKYAYDNWNAGGPRPQYVLLVGDGHYDFTGVSGTTYPNLIPPYLVHVDPWLGETAADNRFVSIDAPENGVDDILPEMAIGRIPARTPADVTAVTDKILAYEAAAAGPWQERAVYVADDFMDPAGDFHALSDEVRLGWLPAAYDDRTIYYNRDYFSATEMKTAIKAAFNADALLLQWFGHGSRFRWGSVSMFNHYDPATLAANDTWPFTMSYSCWTGYFINLFVSNTGQALAEHLLLTPGKGSVADLSPSGLHVGSALLTLNEGLTLALFRDRVRPVGQAVDQAKLDYFAYAGGYYDVLDTSILFGDPALRLRVPVTPPAPPEVAVAAAGSAAALSWPHRLDSASYEVWRGTAPYFDPATAGVQVASVDAGFRGLIGPDMAFTDDGMVPPPPVTIIGDPATNYFWVVRSRNGDGASEISNRVGEFDFGLVAGDE